MFHLEWDGGYIVTVSMCDERIARTRMYPLRKFKHQGDAMVFREHDCPRLNDTQLRMLVKMYNPNVLYERLSENQFKKIT